MANYKLKLDLKKLNGVELVDVQGKKCVVIPVEDNGIFLSPKGAAYLDLAVRQSIEVKYGQTHFVKLFVNKKTFATMSNEAREAIKTVIGNMSPDEYASDNVGAASNPVVSQPQQNVTPEPRREVDVDSLPF